MSVTVDMGVISPGDDTGVEEAWDLKERIRQQAGVLKQRRRFFVDAYKRGTVHRIETVDDGDLVGFAVTRDGGYLLFLAVAPEYQGEGFGRELVAAVADEHASITCHARRSNENALGFYDGLGFERERVISDYYEDGGDAYFLRLGEDTSLKSRLFAYFR